MIVPYYEKLTRKGLVIGILATILILVLLVLYYTILVPFLLEYINILREPWYRIVKNLLETLPVMLFFMLLGGCFFFRSSTI